MSAISIITRLGVLATIASGIVASAPAQIVPLIEPALKIRVYISTFTEHGGDGIYLAELNPLTGDLGPSRLVADVRKASFLALHPNHHYLYSTCEIDDYADAKGGAVAAFKIDAATGNLTLLNHQSSTGQGPHYLSLDREGKNARSWPTIMAVALPCCQSEPTVHWGPRLQRCFTTGRASTKHGKQQRTLTGSMLTPPIASYLYQIWDSIEWLPIASTPRRGRSRQTSPHDFATSPGAGPRHITFHGNGKWAYVINELDSTVNVLRYDSQTGSLTQIQTVSTLPVGATQQDNLTGEIVVHPNGRFLYASNRGHDSIAVFAIDQASGRLKSLGHCPSGGRTPRNFNIEPSGNYLLSANLDSDSVTVLKIDPASGKLSQAAHEIKVVQPYCIQFFSPGD